MKDGFIRVAAATPAVRVADCPYNVGELIRITRAAANDGVHVIVFPELSITAYTCGDLFFHQSLITAAEAALGCYLAETADTPILSVIGLPLAVGDKLYNCAAVCAGGALLGIVPKTHLPNYSEFAEVRTFAPAPEGICRVTVCGREVPFGTKQLFCCAEMPELRAAVEICEDLWAAVPPSSAHAAAGATLLCNPSASPASVGKDDYRTQLITGQSARQMAGYVYANAGMGESTTDVVFSGHSTIAENGDVLAERAPFAYAGDYVASEIDLFRLVRERMHNNTWKQDLGGYLRTSFSLPVSDTVLTRTVDPHPFVPADKAALGERCERILTIQAYGLRQRIARAFAEKCVIAVSGGLDSCLALLVTVRAMDLLGRPREDVIAVTMPCFGTTVRTKTNAERLCAELGVTLRTIDIAASVKQHFCDIGHDPDRHDVVYENGQARERTQIIMDVANAENGLVIGTGDLSELALGWATYNGDHMSMYGVNADVPKTLVRHIVGYAADVAEKSGAPALAACLRDILATPVSPELLPPKDGEIAQITEDLVGPYELHDFYLYLMLRFGFSPRKIFRLARIAFAGAYDDATILNWLHIFTRRFLSQQFKRSCLPDGPKVGSVGISPRGDWRMPSDVSSAVWMEEISSLKQTVCGN